MLMGPPPAPGEATAGPPPFTLVGGMQALMAGERAWVTLDLEPGNGAMLCLIPSAANEGKLHVALGMARAFAVSQAQADCLPEAVARGTVAQQRTACCRTR